MPICPNKLSLAERLGKDLVTRQSVDRLFAEMKAAKEGSFIIDFYGVESITRSFAHQFVVNKETSGLEIEEVNVPLCVEKMFDVVSHPVRRSSASMQPVKMIML